MLKLVIVNTMTWRGMCCCCPSQFITLIRCRTPLPGAPPASATHGIGLDRYAGEHAGHSLCGSSSIGRARPCQGRGHGIVARLPLHFRCTAHSVDTVYGLQRTLHTRIRRICGLAQIRGGDTVKGRKPAHSRLATGQSRQTSSPRHQFGWW